MSNSVTLSGVIVSPVRLNTTKQGKEYLAFRMKVAKQKGPLNEVVFVRVNVYNDTQIGLLQDRGLGQNDRVWVHGELMSRASDEEGKDILEVRGVQVDPVRTDNGEED